MGRFASTVVFYKYREPYPREFFAEVASRLSLRKETRLLDVGCGPGNLVLGFAPFVGSCTAIDVESEMLNAARENAADAGVPVTFLQTSVEKLDPQPNAFDLITIGRALHWLSREQALTIFERVLAENGHIAICGASGRDTQSAWLSEYRRVRDAWSSDPDVARHYSMDYDKWFEGSRFRRVEDIKVPYTHEVTVRDLVKRALSFSVTSPEVLGERRAQFEAEIETAVAPFALDGRLKEQLMVKAAVFS